MKKLIVFPLAFVLTLCMLTGCRRTNTPATTVPSTTVAPTTRPTVPPTTTPPTTMPSTAATEPSMDDLIPGTEDTVNPTNGANQDPASF